MAQQDINVGSKSLAGDGESIRSAFIKINDNFTELYSTTAKFITVNIDGNGSPIAVGTKKFAVVEHNSVIESWTILSSDVGNISVDVKKASYANFPTTVSITSTDKPMLSGIVKNQNNTLAVWSTSVSQGDILEFIVDGSTTLNNVTVILKLRVA